MDLESNHEQVSITEENGSSQVLDVQSVSSATLADVVDNSRYKIDFYTHTEK